MGDRANVFISGVYLYTHWGGAGLPYVVQDALKKKWRWDDDAYLARIIFCEMVKKDLEGETGFGISSYMIDNEHPVIELNCENETISFQSNGTMPFADYIAMSEGELAAYLVDVAKW